LPYRKPWLRSQLRTTNLVTRPPNRITNLVANGFAADILLSADIHALAITRRMPYLANRAFFRHHPDEMFALIFGDEDAAADQLFYEIRIARTGGVGHLERV